MSISPILDVVLGLVFIYLVLSLTCTAIQEAVAQLFNLRARGLRTGIRNALLGVAGGGVKEAVERARDAVKKKEEDELLTAFYRHPVIRSLYEKSALPMVGWRLPSYIPARTFSFALLSVVRDRGGTAATGPLAQMIDTAELPASLKQVLVPFARAARNDVGKFQGSVNAWFDDAMERVSAGYKRRTQLIVFAIALFVVVFANADSIVMTRTLSSDASVREALVAYAATYAQRPAGDDAGTVAPAAAASRDTALGAEPAALPQPMSLDSVVATLGAMSLPIGWDPVPDSVRAEGTWSVIRHRTSDLTLGRLVGLLLTAFAVSLGAPFWFDLLNKIVNIRSAGRAPEERPKPPEELPPAR